MSFFDAIHAQAARGRPRNQVPRDLLREREARQTRRTGSDCDMPLARENFGLSDFRNFE